MVASEGEPAMGLSHRAVGGGETAPLSGLLLRRPFDARDLPKNFFAPSTDWQVSYREMGSWINVICLFLSPYLLLFVSLPGGHLR